MQQLLETTRMLMRPFQLTDAEAAFKWFNDAEVMRFIPMGGDVTLEQTVARIRRYMDHQDRHGFSKWIIHDRASGLAIGDAGLFHLPDGKRVELGYRLARAWWGKGLATEVTHGWLKVAHEWFGLEMVFAFAHAENGASLKVMEKAGFTVCGRETFYGMEAPLYVKRLQAAVEAKNS